MKRVILLIAVLGIAILGGAALNKNILKVRDNPVLVVPASSNGQKLRKAELAIEGMWCAGCAVGAEYNLKAIDGVTDAYVEFNDDLGGGGWVVYEPNKVDNEQILKAVDPYKATVVSDTAYIESR